MPSNNQKKSLTILDVGHGSAAVLNDEGGVVVFDTGRGPQVLKYITAIGIHEVDALILSHADSDHIGGAETLLLAGSIRVKRVYQNPDPTKDTVVFRQLRYALYEAEKRVGTVTEPSLTTSTQISRAGASIEVLFPAATTALGGVGGRGVSGSRLSSNSMSAAIRVTFSPSASVLLGADIEHACLVEWRERGISPHAHTLVFPHHGGLPGNADDADAAMFAHQLASLVNPACVVFSNHKTQYGLPLDSVIAAILQTVTNVKFACTQLPDRFREAVAKEAAWSLHRGDADDRCAGGCIELVWDANDLAIKFVERGTPK